METRMLAVAFICLAVSHGFAGPVELTDEKKLITNLTAKYEKLGRVGRPVQNPNQKLTVEIGLTLIQLLELDEHRQTITVIVWNKMSWYDLFLKWDPSDWGGIEQVHLPPSSIYTPDIMPYYTVPGEMAREDTDVVVKSNGRILWVPPTKLTTLCPGIIPGSDEITCVIKLGSWTEEESRIDLQPYSDDGFLGLKKYIPNPHWDMIDSNGERTSQKYPCCEDPYIIIEYTLTFRRLSSGASMIKIWIPFLITCVLYSVN